MAATTERLNWLRSSPNVRFQLFANYIGADIAANESIVDVRIRCANGPNATTGTQQNDGGSHVGSIDGVGTFASRSQTPFIPSGFGRNAERWNIEARVRIPHNSNGTRANAIIRMVTNWGLGNAYGQEGTYSMALPAIPRTPTGLTVTRVSDSSQKLDWTRVGTYTGVVVQRRWATGSGWSAWSQIAAPSGNLQTYTDTTTVADRRYAYRVAGKTAAGTSAFSGSVEIYTTPAAPSGISAARSGDNIVVSASGTPPYATSYDIQDDGSTVATGVSLPWTHVSPNPAVTHRYRARSNRGTLQSGYSAYSNTVQLLSPPNAPTGLSPNGAVRSVDSLGDSSWRHNPVDSSPQTMFEFRCRDQDTSTWFVRPNQTWTQERVVLSSQFSGAGFTPTPGVPVEWQIRTKGQHPDWSAWSATATVDVITRPGVAINQPEDIWDSSILEVLWDFFQLEDRPQSAWEARLSRDAEIIESLAGSGATGQATFTHHLTAGEWTVGVRAATGGIWSDWAEVTFDAVFDPPEAPALSAVWDEEQGVVTIEVAPGVDPELPETVRVVIERSIDEETWELVGEVTEESALTDGQSLSYGDTQYRATAFTQPGATEETIVVVEARSTALWLSGGPGFAETARLPFSPKPAIAAGLARVGKRYAGRKKKVIYSGTATSWAISVSGGTFDHAINGEETASVDRLTEITQLPERLHMIRTPDGVRRYGMLSGVEMPRQGASGHPSGWNGRWGYSFTLTEGE